MAVIAVAFLGSVFENILNSVSCSSSASQVEFNDFWIFADKTDFMENRQKIKKLSNKLFLISKNSQDWKYGTYGNSGKWFCSFFD